MNMQPRRNFEGTLEYVSTSLFVILTMHIFVRWIDNSDSCSDYSIGNITYLSAIKE